MFSIIVAVDSKLGIGKDGKLPWRLKGEMKYFKDTTMGGVVIMGRNTWESIPGKFRPLTGRVNVIIAKKRDHTFTSLGEALDQLKDQGKKIFVIGGARLYKEAIKREDCESLYVTEIDKDFDCDTFFPEYGGNFDAISEDKEKEEDGVRFIFRVLKRNSNG